MLIEQIQKDLATALKDKKEVEISTLRLLLSEIHNKKIEKQSELSDEDVVVVLRKEVKKRQEAIEAYRRGKRDDLVKKEREELEILSKYLPQEMGSEELEKIIKEVVSQLGRGGSQNFGWVMGEVMKRVKGRIDGAKVAQAVRKLI